MENWTEEQKLAINLENTNIIVSAGAGSGKTTVLSERVLRKLLSGININEILILTFTNKAAAEMKDRIRKKIAQKEELSSQLSYLDSSHISTFDSFSLSIVKKYSYLLNLGADITVGDASTIYLKKIKILDEIFEKLYEAKEADFIKLISNFTLKNDNIIKKRIISISDKLDLKYNKVEFLREYIEKYYSEENISKLVHEYEDLLMSKIKLLKEYLIELEDYEEINIFNELLISNSYEIIKSNINFDFPKIKAKEIDKELVSLAKDVFKEIKELVRYDNLSSIYLETKSYSKVITNIILELEEKVSKFKMDNKIFDFSDIAKMAIKIVSENKIVREELSDSFKEIMIDEYQDTSDLQEEFINLIAKDNVYVVGDIKQSIYRFRNANPYLFKSKYDRAKSNDNIVKIDLTNNFRSREEVVNNINLLFSKLMSNEVGGADYLNDHIMTSGNKNYQIINNQNNNLEVYNYEFSKDSNFKKEEIEIFFVAQDIKNKVENKYQIFDRKINGTRDIEYSDFAILLDRTKHFDLIKNIFIYLNIPVSNFSSNNVAESTEIKLIKNILTLITNKKFDTEFKYAFISIARSYLFEYSDEIIFDMLLNDKYDSSLLEIINSISDNLEFKSLKEILYLIIERFNFYEKFLLVGDINRRIDDVGYIINISETLSNNSYTIDNFKLYLEAIISEGYKLESKDIDSNSGVVLMTIHGSKGLEFPICYFFGLYNKFNLQDLNDRFMFDEEYGIITPYYKDGIGTTFVKELLKEKYYQEEISEKIRLFYVALTRAKEKLIMVSPFSEKGIVDIKDARSFLDFLSYSNTELAPFTKEINLETLNLTRDYNLINTYNFKGNIRNSTEVIIKRKLNISNQLMENKKISKTLNKIISKETKNSINLGIHLHEAFELIDFKDNIDDLKIDELIKSKVKNFVKQIDIDKVLKTIKEFEFISIIDGVKKHGIIDLILEYEDHIKIIDYKLKNVDDPNYLNQLKSYKDYISTITTKKIDIYLYSIIEEKLTLMSV